MPDLGKYAFEVSLAYAGTFILLGLLIWTSFRAAKRVAKDLENVDVNNE